MYFKQARWSWVEYLDGELTQTEQTRSPPWRTCESFAAAIIIIPAVVVGHCSQNSSPLHSPPLPLTHTLTSLGPAQFNWLIDWLTETELNCAGTWRTDTLCVKKGFHIYSMCLLYGLCWGWFIMSWLWGFHLINWVDWLISFPFLLNKWNELNGAPRTVS